jgi:hypothetical protein
MLRSLLFPAPPVAGQRVRVNVPSADPPTRTGRLVALTGDSLILGPDSTAVAPDGGAVRGRLAVSLDSVDALGVSRGVHRNVLSGALVGGIVGTLGSFAVLCTRIHDCLGHRDTDLPLGQFFTILLASAGAGVAIGGTVGAFVRTEHWDDIPLNELDKLRMAAPPAQSAMRVQVGFALFPALLGAHGALPARNR